MGAGNRSHDGCSKHVPASMHHLAARYAAAMPTTSQPTCSAALLPLPLVPLTKVTCCGSGG